MEEPMSNVRFRVLRETLGLSQRQMADVMGVTQSAVARWEADPNEEYARDIGPTTARLLRAYHEGYRPKDWPGT